MLVLELSVDLLAPIVRLIFLDYSILLSFELILAKVSFFLSTGGLVIVALSGLGTTAFT